MVNVFSERRAKVLAPSVTSSYVLLRHATRCYVYVRSDMYVSSMHASDLLKCYLTSH